MAFREVGVVEVREVLRGWLEGAGLRTVAQRSGVDRKTARRYVDAAVAAGLSREDGPEALTDELIAVVIAAVRPVRPDGHGASWDALSAREEQIREWVRKESLSIVKVEELLARSGCVVPYRTMHRFAVQRCGFGVKATTMRVADGEPGMECQIDFAQLGFLVDVETGRRRRVHSLIFTAVVSRHMFVWLTYSQTPAAVIAGCEAAWTFFGGVFKVLIPDNLKAVVTDANAVNPRLSTGWLDYAQHAGFGTDPARVRRPQDKPRVERVVQYVRGNFWAGETFTDLADAQARAIVWCSDRAGRRIHGTTAARPAEMFAQVERRCLLPVPASCDVPIFSRVKVHRDLTKFTERRDSALIRLLVDTGIRSSELLGLTVTDLDSEQDVALVLGKGGRGRAVPFGNRTGEALRRYLRLRASTPTTTWPRYGSVPVDPSAKPGSGSFSTAAPPQASGMFTLISSDTRWRTAG